MKIGLQVDGVKATADRAVAERILSAAGPMALHLHRPGAKDPSRIVIVGSGQILFAVDAGGGWALPTDWAGALELRSVRHLRDSVAEIGAELAPLLPALGVPAPSADSQVG